MKKIQIILISVLLGLSAVFASEPPVQKRMIALLPFEGIDQGAATYCMLLMTQDLIRYGYMSVAEQTMIQKMMSEKNLSVAGMTEKTDEDMAAIMQAANVRFTGRFDINARSFTIIDNTTGKKVMRAPLNEKNIRSGKGDVLYNKSIRSYLLSWMKKNALIKTYVCGVDEVDGNYIYVRFGSLDGMRKYLRFFNPAVSDDYGGENKMRVRRVNADIAVLKVKKGTIPEVGTILQMDKRFFD